MRLFMLFALLLLAASACKREKVKPKGPVEVEYRVTSSSGAQAADITYVNETGGMTLLEDATLPFSVKFKFSQRPGSLTVLAILSDQGGQQQSVTGTILVDGQQVKSETGMGTTAGVNVTYILQ